MKKRPFLATIFFFVVFALALVTGLTAAAINRFYPWWFRSDQIAVTGLIGPDDEGIYLVDLHRRDFVRLTPPDILARSPIWSPDGQRLAFIYATSRTLSREEGIGIINTDGSNLTYTFSNRPSQGQVILSGLSHMAWSPDGSQILFNTWAGHEPKLYLLTIESGQIQPLELVLGSIDYRGFVFSWSSQGILALELNGEIYTLDLETMRLTFLASGKSPFWTPDGNWLTFQCKEDQPMFCRVSPNGQTQEVILQQGEIHYTDSEKGLSWSPDGRFILFLDVRGESDPYYMSVLNINTGLVHHIYRIHSRDYIQIMDVMWPPR